MAIRLIDGSEFLHVPKTGGMWVAEVLRDQNLIAEHVGHTHAVYDLNLWTVGGLIPRWAQTGRARTATLRRRSIAKTLATCDARPAPFRFCFVRNPISWYESWWKYMMQNDWRNWGIQNAIFKWHPNSSPNGLGSDDFNEFVRNVLRVRPGYVTELYSSYAKPGISFIGKTESLVEDLIKVLTHLDLDFDEDKIRAEPKKNVSKTKADLIEWDESVKEAVIVSEMNSILTYGYDVKGYDHLSKSLAEFAGRSKALSL